MRGARCSSTPQREALRAVGDRTELGTDRAALWTMRNGYALPTRAGLAAIGEHLSGADEDALDDLRSRLRLGLHTDVEVTDGPAPRPLVSQIFCSALPVAYARLPAPAGYRSPALCWRRLTRARCWRG